MFELNIVDDTNEEVVHHLCEEDVEYDIGLMDRDFNASEYEEKHGWYEYHCNHEDHEDEEDIDGERKIEGQTDFFMKSLLWRGSLYVVHSFVVPLNM